MKVRFAVAPSGRHATVQGIAAFVTDLEELRFDTAWLSDLPLQPAIDPIVGLAHAAGVTSKLKLGANIVPIGRNPVTLAKMLAQIDQVSRGRLLLNFVVGLGDPAERAALGVEGIDRGQLLGELTPLLRSWWAGETVDYSTERYQLRDVASPGRPVQDPLEVWFGGRSPAAISRAGRFADGWLGSAVSPAEATDAVSGIQRAATGAGRSIDPEHFGISLAYAAAPVEATTLSELRRRQPRLPIAELLPVGPDALASLVHRYVDGGISKFVVRPIGTDATDRPHLQALADVVHDLQS